MTIVTTTRGRNGSGMPSTPIQTKDIADNAVTSPKLSEDVRQSLAAAAGAVRYDAAQELTSEQKEQARTNITAMANTPSGDPMHYIYETAGAEWIPYADISTDGLEDWQVATLDRAQAQADGGVWWHNDIFVSVQQNRINYISTIGTYPVQLPLNGLYLSNNLKATTNYKEQGTSQLSVSLNDSCRFTNLHTICISKISANTCIRAFSFNNRLYRILGTLDLGPVSAENKAIDVFSRCPNLMDVNIMGIKVNLNLSGCPQLRTNSVAYMITNASTATITITLAPAVYTAAMADSAVQAALADKTNVTLANAGSNA